jgi:hypothetical protein
MTAHRQSLRRREDPDERQDYFPGAFWQKLSVRQSSSAGHRRMAVGQWQLPNATLQAIRAASLTTSVLNQNDAHRKSTEQRNGGSLRPHNQTRLRWRQSETQCRAVMLQLPSWIAHYNEIHQRTRLSDIVPRVSSFQLTKDPDCVRSFGGYNNARLNRGRKMSCRGTGSIIGPRMPMPCLNIGTSRRA